MSKDEIPAHLQLCDPASFSIKRAKWGRGFRFFNGKKDAVKDEGILGHLRSVPVPNTWSEVRLSHEPDTYILALGYDGSGKLQYLYHPDFLEYRNLQKFERLYNFGLKLPRHQVAKDDFSARTFRAWAGTVLAVKYARKAPEPDGANRKIFEQNPQRKLKPILVELVAKKLGNTTAICEEYYIHPQVLEAVLGEGFRPDPCEPRFIKKNLYHKHECRTLEILWQHRKDNE